VRAGILSYGSAPDHPAARRRALGAAPAMSLRTRIIGTQSLAPGDTVGYGSSFTAAAPMRIGIVACGYADGYPRLPQRHAGAGGRPAQRTVGRVSMDMLAVDLSTLPDAGPGSEVTLWGRSSAGAVLPIDEVAQAAGTIAYELMCALAPRVPVALG
jgi:alanine racemase